MNSFFNHTDKIALLQSVSSSWVGTPFFAHGKIKGAGVDCVHIAAEIYLESGLFTSYVFPQYTLDGGHHAESSKIIQWVEKCGHFEKLSMPDYRPSRGDLLCFKIGKSAWHVGILIRENEFIHCWQRYGVMISRIDDPSYGNRLTELYRPIQKGVV